MHIAQILDQAMAASEKRRAASAVPQGVQP